MPEPSELPIFDGKTARFISYFVDTEDIGQAAARSSLPLEKAERLLRKKPVRAEINRRLEIVHQEQAKLLAKYRKVTTEFLDDKLVQAVNNGAKRGDNKALELGYRRVGIFRDGEFIGAPKSAAQAADTRPMIYRAMERTVVRTESVTERAELAEPESLALPAPPEILNY